MLIALVVMCALIYFAWRLIVKPGMDTQNQMARSNAEAAKHHAMAAKANADAAASNQRSSEANERTSAHLEKVAMIILNYGLQQGNLSNADKTSLRGDGPEGS